jgi:hypothetical protein
MSILIVDDEEIVHKLIRVALVVFETFCFWERKTAPKR